MADKNKINQHFRNSPNRRSTTAGKLIEEGANKLGSWFLEGLGALGRILNAGFTSPTYGTNGQVSYARNILDANRQRLLSEALEQALSRGSTYVMPANYIVGKGNPIKGEEKISQMLPWLQAITRGAELYFGPKAIKGVKNTPKTVVNVAAKAGNKTAKKVVIAREINLAVRKNRHKATKTADMRNGIVVRNINGKTRIQLPTHTDTKPREIVLEPQGNNKYYVHMRVWDDVEKHIPGNISNVEKSNLFQTLYETLPDGSEILFPKSGPENYGTRGTVAGLQRLSRDPRFQPGTPGTLYYKGKNNEVLTYQGTSFIKKPLFGFEGFPFESKITMEDVLGFIDNDIIPRLKAQEHQIESYKPNIRTADFLNDIFDLKMRGENAGAWFSPATNEVTLRGSLENQDFGLAIHEAGGHGIRYNMQPDYKPVTREQANAYLADPENPVTLEPLLKAHIGNEVFNNFEVNTLGDAYPEIASYFENFTNRLSGKKLSPEAIAKRILDEQGAVNTQFRAKLSENGKLTGKALDKKIMETSEGVILRMKIEQGYTSIGTLERLSKITGIDIDDLNFYNPASLLKLADKFPQVKDMANKVKYAMTKVGEYAFPVVGGGYTLYDLLNNLNNQLLEYKKPGGKINIIKLFKDGGQVRKMQTAAGGPIKRLKDGYRYIPDGKGGWNRISDNDMSDVFATYVVEGKDKRADVRIDKKSENFDRKFKYDETEIPFIKDKEITLTNAGLYTGAKLSTNLLDSIAKYAKISGLPLKTAVGLVAKETSLGNPTVDSSLKKLSGDNFSYQLAKALNGGLHINEGKALNPKDLINFHYEELNPYLGLKNIAYKKSVGNIGDYGREGPFGNEDFLKRYRELLKLGENYSDNLAKKLLSNFNPNKSVLQAGFEFYKLNPRKYNYNQTNYPQLVEERGNMVYNSPEFKSWLLTSEYKKQGGKMNILEFLKNGSGIHIKKKNRGKFTSYCGGKVTDECILKGKNSSNPAIRKRATFADNARHFKHKSGGNIVEAFKLKRLILNNLNNMIND